MLPLFSIENDLAFICPHKALIGASYIKFMLFYYLSGVKKLVMLSFSSRYLRGERK